MGLGRTISNTINSSITDTFSSLDIINYSDVIFWGKPQELSVTSALATFTDNSGKSNNASQSVETNKPSVIANGIGTNNAIDFDGVDNFLRCNNIGPIIDGQDTPWSIHFAFKADSVVATQVIAVASHSVNTTDYMWFGLVGGGAWRFAKQTTTPDRINVDFGTADTNEHIISIVHKGTTTDIWFDGIKVADGVAQDLPSTTYDLFSFGAFVRNTVANYFDGKLGETIIFSRANTDVEVKDIHRHLAKTQVTSVPVFVDLFMGTGQSNMEGRGLTGDASPSVTKGVAYRYNSSSLTSITGDPVGGAVNFSCIPSFVNQWKASTTRSVIYIEQATSGAALLVAADIGSGNWKKGVGSLYTTALNEFNAAVSFIFNKTTFILNSRRILWQQGEREALSINGTTITGPLYQADLESLIDNFSADCQGSIDHFHIFELGAHSLGTGESDWASIRLAQNNTDVSRAKASVIFTNAKLYPSQSKMEDTVHYNKTGLNEMGTQGAKVAATYR